MPDDGLSGAAALDGALLREAAEWYALLRSDQVTEADRRRWRAWLGRLGSPQRGAWQRVEAISRRFAHAAREAPARAVLHAGAQARRRALKSLAVVGGAALAGWMGARTETWQSLRADYASATGEIRAVALADGTQVWLATDSAIDVRYDAAERAVRLLHGEIHVLTAQAAGRPRDARPFFVDTAHGRLRALGTRFTVRQGDALTRVAVYEGAVEVRPARPDAAPAIVGAGEELSFAPDGAGAPAAADPAGRRWAQGLLVADDMRLDDFLAELGRYRRGYLGCDPAVAGLRLVGVYSLRDTDHALAALARTLPVRVRHLTPWWVRVGPA